MSMKHKNPYRANSLNAKLFGYMQAKQVVTRKELMGYGVKELGMGKAAAQAAVTTLLSPRLSSNRGDPRGNLSAKGHLYFIHGMKTPGQEKKFRLRWREVPLEKRTKDNAEVPQKASAVKDSTPVEA